MIGLWSSKAGPYLRFVAIGTLLVFGLPMLLWPLRWAGAFGWEIPANPDLAIYFGRCLASAVCVLGFMAFRAASRPAVQSFYFDIMLGLIALMIGVHAYGALLGIQPISETIEIAYWVLLIVFTLLFYPRESTRSG